MAEYVATFHTHFGAMRFAREIERRGWECRMAPVPRKLSSSCGTCVRFAPPEPYAPAQSEDLEAIYRAEGSAYALVQQYE